MIKATARLDTSNLRGLQKSLEHDLDRIVRETAFEIQTDAQERAPVDTGAMRASVFTVTGRFDGGAAAMAAARRPRKAKDGSVRVADVHKDYPRPKKNKDEAVVAAGVLYARWVNNRTGFFTAAIWKHRKTLREKVRELVGRYTK